MPTHRRPTGRRQVANSQARVHDVDPSSLVATLRTSYARPGPLDRRLWALGHRPIRISKYGTGLALLSPDLRPTAGTG